MHDYDLVLIGAMHNIPASKVENPEKKLQRFMSELLGCGHLILEGTRSSTFREIHPDKLDFAAIATNYFKGKTYLLEGCVNNFSAIAEGYELRKDLIGLYTIIRGLSRIDANPKGFSKETQEFLSRYLKEMKNYLGLSNMGVKDSLEKFDKLMHDFGEPLNLFSSIGIAFTWYIAEIREYEILCPRTMELVPKLNDKKREIVGPCHIDGIEQCLKGEELEAPKKWPQFIGGLGQQTRDFIRLIEDKLFR